ncbi:MAG: glycoside hydrolase family 2 protein [Clostridia bacterium]|nr:glycoside hydrolase family 2 protein [Clostridia bacterium]
MMDKINLNGLWEIRGGKYSTTGEIPGSVYSSLLSNGLMEDPFYRDNEIKALEIMDNDFTFTKKFEYNGEFKKAVLVCEGIDTVCDLYINGKKIANVDNMHRTYRFDVTDYLVAGANEIKAFFPCLDKIIKELDKDMNLPRCVQPLKGYMHVRKAHCMFGWDWGPRLPDAGIWRDIYIMREDEPVIEDVRILQNHGNGIVLLNVNVSTNLKCDIEIEITSPSGEILKAENGKEVKIENPELWWPNGYGKQNLYKIEVRAIKDGKTTDKKEKKVGLRTLTLNREKDQWGESFCHEINGIKIFAMGADYIPEDNILSRINKERTRVLLEDCIKSNFNAIRVWGGGYYPDDFFFELCDELGLIIFFDCMFACAGYPFGDKFTENVKGEIIDNFKRIRHHACIGVISGNNEIEECAVWWKDEKLKEGYLDLFEKTIPELLNEICPEIPYVPSSPSSFGGFNDPDNENYGDNHYWSVWHGNLPFTEYRNHYFRYLSEFGFQSFPTMKTIEEFTLPQDRNPFSRVMELHQRNASANGKILNYLSQTYLYPNSFENVVYASQLLQAEAMKYGVEHLRRNRGRCMGTLYWQLNDIWPVASWASIDSNGRYKALHYEAKRFYEPIHISCKETGEYSVRQDVTDERTIGYETKAEIYVNNDTLNDVEGVVEWQLNSVDGSEIKSGDKALKVKALSVAHLDEIDFNKTNIRTNYLYFAFKVDGKVVSSGTVIFTKPKHFDFIDPQLTVSVKGDEITVKSNAYAKYVEISDETGDLKLTDNYFDMNKGEVKVKILSGEPKGLKVKSVFDIK